MILRVPARTEFVLKRGDSGTPVYALQKALTVFDGSITVDAEFGPQTEALVKRYQSIRGLTPDGICGPVTQARLARSIAALFDDDLPKGILRSICEGESGGYVAAVNYSVAGGVDCGYVQRRVYEPYTQSAIKSAFDSRHQFLLLRNRLLNLKATYRTRPAVPSDERAWRLAILSHNYPAGADRLSRTKESDLSMYWTSPQEWVKNIGARFGDACPVETPLQWCQRYSLGNPTHSEPGLMTRYVSSW